MLRLISKMTLRQLLYSGFLVKKERLVTRCKAPFLGNPSSIDDQSKFDCSSKQLELNRKTACFLTPKSPLLELTLALPNLRKRALFGIISIRVRQNYRVSS